MRGLYAIADVDFLSARSVPVGDFVRAVLSARPAALQLRAKSLGARDTLSLLGELSPLARAAGVPFFANDRPDLALLAGCDGVHVGQSDLPVADVRRFAKSLRVGVSTHDEAELRRALAATPDYVAFGPVFGTTSKASPEPTVGVAALARAHVNARAAGIPLVAIGGVDLRTVAAIRGHADGFAVISALLPAEGLAAVPARARELQAAFATPRTSDGA
ncbi:MAG TPA: thiamine phosphate synthase [Polyangiaceae bacterium]|nr:thiamine phosphate synthase [Polyangiaceae bacterium]